MSTDAKMTTRDLRWLLRDLREYLMTGDTNVTRKSGLCERIDSALEAIDASSLAAPPTGETPKPGPGCNLHSNCEEANAKAKADGKPRPTHCSDECCEECYGN